MATETEAKADTAKLKEWYNQNIALIGESWEDWAGNRTDTDLPKIVEYYDYLKKLHAKMNL